MKNIPLFKVNMTRKAKRLASKVLMSGMIGEGLYVEEFRNKLCELFNHTNVTCLNSCTSALVLALRLSGVKHGDTVLSVPFTFPATNCAIKEVGGNIEWSKISDFTPCIDTRSSIEILKKNRNIKHVVFTLVGGLLPIGFENFINECSSLGIKVIADCAHGLTTMYKLRHISHWVDYCCFSFQAIKQLTTGNGGALTCLSSKDHKRANKLKWFGMDRTIPEGKTRLQHQMEYIIEDWGYKYEMNDIAAAIGLANFNKAIKSISISKDNARYYMNNIEDKDILPIKERYAHPSFWVFPLKFNDMNRLEKLERELSTNNISHSRMWKWNNEHLCFKQEYITKRNEWLFIPCGHWVTKRNRKLITSLINKG